MVEQAADCPVAGNAVGFSFSKCSVEAVCERQSRRQVETGMGREMTDRGQASCLA